MKLVATTVQHLLRHGDLMHPRARSFPPSSAERRLLRVPVTPTLPNGLRLHHQSASHVHAAAAVLWATHAAHDGATPAHLTHTSGDLGQLGASPAF